MSNTFLNENGQIREEHRPAIYLDTSFLADYWLVEGTEIDLPEEHCIRENPWEREAREIVGEFHRLAQMIELRKLLVLEAIEALPVFTPLAMLELESWHAETAFKQVASNSAGFLSIQRKSRKEIGQMLAKVYDRWRREEENPKPSSDKGTPPATILMTETRLNWSFAQSHALQGLVYLPLKNLPLSEKDVLGTAGLIAFLQVGLADVLHLLAARQLGCEFFASFDSDFIRVRSHILDDYGLTLLSSPSDIATVLRRGRLEA